MRAMNRGERKRLRERVADQSALVRGHHEYIRTANAALGPDYELTGCNCLHPGNTGHVPECFIAIAFERGRWLALRQVNKYLSAYMGRSKVRIFTTSELRRELRRLCKPIQPVKEPRHG